MLKESTGTNTVRLIARDMAAWLYQELPVGKGHVISPGKSLRLTRVGLRFKGIH